MSKNGENNFKKKPNTSNSIQKPQKTVPNQTKTPTTQTTLTKKLSLALEEKLNLEENKDPDFEILKYKENFEDDDSSLADEKEKKNNLVLEKAKALVLYYKYF